MAYGHNHSSPDDARRTPATTENDVPPKLSMLGTRCGGLLQTKGLRAFQIDVGPTVRRSWALLLETFAMGNCGLEQPCDTGKQKLSPLACGLFEISYLCTA